ncbi:DUF4365 domain-containing protein [Nocardia asteroides]
MKEQLSVAYAAMVIAAAGCTVASFSADFNSVDMGVQSSAEYRVKAEPRFDIQLKCTSQDIVREKFVHWKIDRRTHSKLTNPKRYNPSLIGVLVVPADIGAWLDHDADRLLTRSTMYYMRGIDMPELPDGQENLTLRISRENRFNIETVLEIMRTIGDGEYNNPIGVN